MNYRIYNLVKYLNISEGRLYDRKIHSNNDYADYLTNTKIDDLKSYIYCYLVILYDHNTNNTRMRRSQDTGTRHSPCRCTEELS